jgi:hypothetical protein
MAIPARRLTTMTWAIGGALSALTAVLVLPAGGSPDLEAMGPSLLLRALAAAGAQVARRGLQEPGDVHDEVLQRPSDTGRHGRGEVGVTDRLAEHVCLLREHLGPALRGPSCLHHARHRARNGSRVRVEPSMM